jgi:uncharacterized repeat protein (TIGR02543 family)
MKKDFFGKAVKTALAATALVVAAMVFTGCEQSVGGEDTPQYTITFDCGEGSSAVNPISGPLGILVNRPDDPTWIDHTFTGWFNTGAGGNEAVREMFTWPYRLTGSVTMFAGWKDSENATSDCTLTFDSAGGSQVASVAVYDSGTKVSRPADPTREGYTFLGWFSEKEAGTLYAWPYPVTGDVTMYAHWRDSTQPQPERYTLTFESHGGSAVAEITADQGTEVEKPADPTKAGYTFSGWFSAASDGTAHTWPYTLSASVTMHAQWTVRTYSISYELNGGTNASENPVTYTIEGLPITLSNPTRDHSTFEGWYTDAEFTGTKVTQINTGNIGIETLYAKWTGIDYTITFDSNGGSDVTAITEAGGTAVTKPADPTWEGFTFLGWFSEDDEGTLYSWPYPVTESVTMYARWRDSTENPLTQYTLTFESEGGSDVTAITADQGIPVAKPADPIKEGYTFNGWYSTATGGTKYEWPHTLNDNVTLYAQWTATQYSISYELNGGTNIENPTETYSIESAAIPLPANPTRSGYTFAGWYDNAGFTGDAVTEIAAGSTGNKTFRANWTAISYNINYELNGGTIAANPPLIYTTESAPITLPTPARTGYTFGGWFDNEGLTGTKVTSILKGSMGDKTFYAKWTAAGYSITYNNVDGASNTNPERYTTGNLPVNLSPPTRTGYTFGGWYENAGFTVSPLTQIAAGSTGDKTLWAKWTANTYTVAYNGNGNSGGTAPGNTSHSYGTASALANNSGNLVKTSYTFAGWNTQANGSGDSYTGGQSVTNLTSTAGGTVTLYAQWKNYVSITVTIGGSGNILVSGADITISKSGANEAPASFTATVTDGYTIDDWYLDYGQIDGNQSTAQSITINAANFPNGNYQLTVVVTRNGRYDSALIRFTVTD